MATDRTQLEKFKDAARELECDDDATRFRERLKKLVTEEPADAAKPSDD